jgi:nucleoside-diphosphate-sugar epimerase
VDENTATAPTRFNGCVLLEMEEVARASGCQIVVARLSGIYGPDRQRLIRLAGKGDALTSASRAFSNRIHIEDAGAALAHLLSLKNPQDLYLVSDDQPVAQYEVVGWLARQMGRLPAEMLPTNDSGLGKKVSNKRLRDSGFVFKFPDYRAGYGDILQHRNHNEFSG